MNSCVKFFYVWQASTMTSDCLSWLSLYCFVWRVLHQFRALELSKYYKATNYVCMYVLVCMYVVLALVNQSAIRILVAPKHHDHTCSRDWNFKLEALNAKLELRSCIHWDLNHWWPYLFPVWWWDPGHLSVNIEYILPIDCIYRINLFYGIVREYISLTLKVTGHKIQVSV